MFTTTETTRTMVSHLSCPSEALQRRTSDDPSGNSIGCWGQRARCPAAAVFLRVAEGEDDRLCFAKLTRGECQLHTAHCARALSRPRPGHLTAITDDLLVEASKMLPMASSSAALYSASDCWTDNP